MQLFFALLGGLGIGSLLTQIVTHFMTRRASAKDRLYQEKRDAFLGLLGALHDVAKLPSEDNWRAYVRWQTHCSLFASTAVMAAAAEVVDVKGAPQERRNYAFQKLVHAMRLDLGQWAPPPVPPSMGPA